VPFELTPRQAEANRLLGTPSRHVLLDGGARSGKTFLLVRAVVVRALKAPGSRHGIFRFRYNHLRASIWLETLPKVMRLCFPGVVLRDKTQDNYTLLPNDSEIWFGGFDDKERIEKILGKEFATIYANECSQIPYTSVTTARTRLAQVTTLRQKFYYDANPPARSHWLYREFVEGRDPASKATLANRHDFARLNMNPADNAANLTPEYIASLQALPERQRRRFYEGLYTDDTEGALWTLDALERCRAAADDLPGLDRVVIAVDPSGTSGPEDERSDEVGIVAVGRGRDGTAYVLGDYTLRAAADGWARVVLAAYDKHQADAIVAERNFGGDMVAAMFRNLRRNLPVRLVTASRGKHLRAEPVAALYERDKIRHLGRFEALEDQLLGFTTAGYVGDRSPDRADALIHGLTDLMLGFHQQHGTAGPVGVEAGSLARPDYGGHGHPAPTGGVATIG
jgi:hypothetical protein